MCKLDKDSSDFYKRSDGHGDNLQGTCKSCMNKSREKYRNNPDNWARELAGRRQFRKDNPEHCRRQDRKRALKNLFGLTLEEYASLVQQQNGLCAICGKPEYAILNGKVKNMAVDHCHTTGTIRGLLCARCNRAIGLFGDEIGLLAKAIAYLEPFHVIPA